MSTLAKVCLGMFCCAVLSMAFLACDDVRFRENPVQIDSFEQSPAPMVD
ncbi:MAG: hypothetical protein JRF33_24895, partial [Deltaproteobacteria bacterium]|nr:hypothetical protein [Deltaproteobacteria bacterium]